MFAPFFMNPLGGDFVIAGSGLFDGASTSILSRTPSSAGNSKKFKIHAVIKRAELSAVQAIAGANSDGTFQFYFDANDKINIESYYSSAYKTRLITTQVFRDTGAYYAIDFEYDSTVSTPSASSIKLLINGVQITAFDTETYPSQNEDAGWNLAERHRVGGRGNNSANPFEGYIARFVNIDGTHNDAMGEITDDGFYQLNDVSGLTFGTNGFLLSGQNVASGFDSSSGSNPVYTGSSASVGFSGANAENVIDRTRSTTSTTGNLQNLASTGDDGRVVWEVDLGSSKAIKQITVAGILGSNIGDLAGFDLAHSTDSSSWTVMGSRSNISTAARDYTVTGDVTGRYIAVLAKAINWGSSAWTAAVLEASSEINNSFIKAGNGITATNDSPTNGDA